MARDDAMDGGGPRERGAASGGPAPSAVVDIDAARAFLAVVKAGGVTAAAREVGRTPAAVSMQLKKLEETLGVLLFERGPRGMTLTADGRRFEEHARHLMAAHRAALDAFRAPALTGHVRIGLVDEFGDLRLSRLLADFAESHPDVCVSVTLSSTFDLCGPIDAGEIDLAVLVPGGDTPWREGDEIVYSEPLVWVGLRGGSAPTRDPLPVAMARHGCSWRRLAIDSLERRGVRYRVAYASNSYAGQLAAVSADLAISLAPASAMKPGFVVLGAAEGLPPVGDCQIALRYAEEARERPEVAALGAALACAYNCV